MSEQQTREQAWQTAITLYDSLGSARQRAAGGMGGGGYRDPHALTEISWLRNALTGIVAKHGFQGTRVDPDADLSWVARQSASWECPVVSEARR